MEDSAGLKGLDVENGSKIKKKSRITTWFSAKATEQMVVPLTEI